VRASSKELLGLVLFIFGQGIAQKREGTLQILVKNIWLIIKKIKIT